MDGHNTEKNEEEVATLNVTVRLPSTLVEQIDTHAEKDDRTRGGMIRKVLNDYYQKRSETT